MNGKYLKEQLEKAALSAPKSLRDSRASFGDSLGLSSEQVNDLYGYDPDENWWCW